MDLPSPCPEPTGFLPVAAFCRPAVGRWLLGWVAGVLFLLSGGVLRSAEARFAEDAIKAAFVLNFTAFVEWPAPTPSRPAKPLVLGVLAKPDFLQLVQEIASRKSDPARPRTIRGLASADEAAACDLVFVQAGNDVAGVLKSVAGRPTLTVSDGDGFLESGGMIELSRSGENVVFDVHQRHVESAGLRMNSRVLKLARKVLRGGGEASPRP